VPVLAIMVYGLALGTAKRDRPSVLVLLCSLTAFALLLVTSGKEVYIRVFVPMLPLFGIPLCNAFGKLEKGKLRNAFLALFALAAIYSAAFTSLYVMHYALDNAGNVPLYGFISGLPEGSTIVVHPNLFRQVEFITGRDAIAGNLLAGMDAAQIMEALGKTNATHVAISCGRELWSNEIVQQLVEQGFLHEVYRDECNTLYKIER